jgi:hypothetical protein|tara:strand:- start:38 stop:286 length:249 start_codon:yes stop_codon:yes gene_type:complete
MLSKMDKVCNAIYQLLDNDLIDQDDADVLLANLKDKDENLKTGMHLKVELFYEHPPSDFFPKGAKMPYPPLSHYDFLKLYNQ